VITELRINLFGLKWQQLYNILKSCEKITMLILCIKNIYTTNHTVNIQRTIRALSLLFFIPKAHVLGQGMTVWPKSLGSGMTVKSISVCTIDHTVDIECLHCRLKAIVLLGLTLRPDIELLGDQTQETWIWHGYQTQYT